MRDRIGTPFNLTTNGARPIPLINLADAADYWRTKKVDGFSSMLKILAWDAHLLNMGDTMYAVLHVVPSVRLEPRDA